MKKSFNEKLMNNKRKSKVVDTSMEEEMEKSKIFGKFESMTKKRSSEILSDEKKIFGFWGKRQTEKSHFGK